MRTNRFLFLIGVATAPALINLPATETASQTAKNPSPTNTKARPWKIRE